MVLDSCGPSTREPEARGSRSAWDQTAQIVRPCFKKIKQVKEYKTNHFFGVCLYVCVCDVYVFVCAHVYACMCVYR